MCARLGPCSKVIPVKVLCSVQATSLGKKSRNTSSVCLFQLGTTKYITVWSILQLPGVTAKDKPPSLSPPHSSFLERKVTPKNWYVDVSR